MKTLEEDLLNSNQRHYISYKDPSGETDREMSFCVEDYLKYKKALEIIKNDFNLFLNAERWKVDMHKYEQMYKENYDLLKEALL